MDRRTIDCLRNGLPLDQDVYDLALTKGGNTNLLYSFNCDYTLPIFRFSID